MRTHTADPEIVGFAKRVGIVATGALVVLALTTVLLLAATTDLRNALTAESRSRFEADSLEQFRREQTDRRIDRMAAIMEFVVLEAAAETDPAERRTAQRELRRMRHVAP